MTSAAHAASQLNYAEDGDSECIVLLHPIGLDHHCWDAVSERLTKRFRVLRPDLPGHGASGPSRPDMRVDDYAASVAAWIDATGCAPVALVGLSFGGMIAQTLALDRPDLLRALVVSGCPSGFPSAEAREAIAERGRAALDGGMQAVLEATLERWFTPAFRASGGDAAAANRLLRDDPREWARAWTAISHFGVSDRLHEIKMPTLCIAGALDAAAPVAALEAIAEGIAGAKLKVLEQAPHMMQIECPLAYADAVATFLEENG